MAIANISDAFRLKIGEYFIKISQDVAMKERKRLTAVHFGIGESTAYNIGTTLAKKQGTVLETAKKIATDAQKIEAVQRVRAGESINIVRNDYHLGHATLTKLVKDTAKLEAKKEKDTAKLEAKKKKVNLLVKENMPDLRKKAVKVVDEEKPEGIPIDTNDPEKLTPSESTTNRMVNKIAKLKDENAKLEIKCKSLEEKYEFYKEHFIAQLEENI